MSGRDLADYVTVNERIAKFYERYPKGRIDSEILVDDGKRIVIQANVYRDDESAPCTGHAEEIRGQGMVNKTSAVENCETSAWGRALAAAGLEIKKGIASREEMEKVARVDVEKTRVKKLSVSQVEKLSERLKDVDADKVNLALVSLGADSYADLTVAQTKELLQKVAA